MAFEECWELFDRRKRDKHDGPVKCYYDTVHHIDHGQVLRPYLVTGNVVPCGTADRKSDVPEPLNQHPMAGEPILQKGHIMGLRLGGPDVSYNIVPQWGNFQGNGVWAKMEEAIRADALKVKLHQKDHYLFFSCLVWYHKSDPWLASTRNLNVPIAFIVYTQQVNESGEPVGPRQERFSAEQQPDATDRKIVLASEIPFNQARTGDTEMQYDDLRMVPGKPVKDDDGNVVMGTDGKPVREQKVKYKKTGEDPQFAWPQQSFSVPFDSANSMDPLANELYVNARAKAVLPGWRGFTPPSKHT